MEKRVFRSLFRKRFLLILIAFCLLLIGAVWFASSMKILPLFISVVCSIALTLLAVLLAIYDIWFRDRG